MKELTRSALVFMCVQCNNPLCIGYRKIDLSQGSVPWLPQYPIALIKRDEKSKYVKSAIVWRVNTLKPLQGLKMQFAMCILLINKQSSENNLNWIHCSNNYAFIQVGKAYTVRKNCVHYCDISIMGKCGIIPTFDYCFIF